MASLRGIVFNSYLGQHHPGKLAGKWFAFSRGMLFLVTFTKGVISCRLMSLAVHFLLKLPRNE